MRKRKGDSYTAVNSLPKNKREFQLKSTFFITNYSPCLHTPLVLATPLCFKPPEAVDVCGDDLLGVDPHTTEEVLVNHRGLLLLGSSQRQVETVEEPGEELPGVPLLCDLELLLGAQHNSLNFSTYSFMFFLDLIK